MKALSRFIEGAPPREPVLYEAIDWRAVASSLEQSSADYQSQLARATTSEAATVALTASAVLHALAGAIREGLE